MHVPDGFLDAPTSVATGAVAVVAVGVALRGARHELDDKTAPLAGLVATFVFATQMLNFPVGAGTSGHLLGGALAAVLVGPFTGLLCMSVVFLVQALLFADGGITALGTNIDLMGLVTVAVGFLVFRLLQAVLPKRLALVAPAAAVSALVVGARRRALLRRALRRRRSGRHPARIARGRDGRLARPDRDRRGGHHRPGRRQHRRRPPRPRARRAAGCSRRRTLEVRDRRGRAA